MATTKEPVDETLTKIGREDLSPGGREAWRDLCACVTAMKHERDEARRLIETPHDGSPMQRERDALRVRITALEAERDEARAVLDLTNAHHADIQRERDALREQVDAEQDAKRDALGEVDRLRERVKALEAELAREKSWSAGVERAASENMQRLESRLAAIRQRAGDTRELIAAWNAGAAKSMVESMLSVARYILGPDATEAAPMTDEEARRVCAETGVDTKADLEQALEMVRAAQQEPEPTTAKAFATVREAIPFMLGSDGKAGRGRFALSLLERRMGVLARAARLVLGTWDREDPCSDEERDVAMNALHDALTGAPAVFTPEEIEAAMRLAGVAPLEREETHDALRGAQQ